MTANNSRVTAIFLIAPDFLGGGPKSKAAMS
jgi:hypothetical protein